MRSTPSSRRLWTILILRGHAIHTVMTWHLLILPDETGGKTATDGTWTTMHHVTMSCRLTGEVPAFDDALETFALAGANDINPLAVAEEAGVVGVSRRKLVVRGDAEFLDDALRSRAEFLEVTEQRLRHAGFFLVFITKLNRAVAVLADFVFTWRSAFPLTSTTVTGDRFTFVGVNLRHAEFCQSIQ